MYMLARTPYTLTLKDTKETSTAAQVIYITSKLLPPTSLSIAIKQSNSVWLVLLNGYDYSLSLIHNTLTEASMKNKTATAAVTQLAPWIGKIPEFKMNSNNIRPK